MHATAIILSFAGVLLTVAAAGFFLAALVTPGGDYQRRATRQTNGFITLGVGLLVTLGGTVILTYSTMGA